MSGEPITVLAIDPGTHKCGIAVVSGPDCLVLHRAVIDTPDLPAIIAPLIQEHSPSVILMGNGTYADKAAESISKHTGVPVKMVDEKMTSVAARKRFFLENPPRGLRRLLPTSLQTPVRPYDDYVAIILAERYLSGHSEST